MAAVRTRILFGDDTDLLAPVHGDVLDHPALDVLLAASTQGALLIAQKNLDLRVAVLPASGDLDGTEVMRQLKSGGREIAVLLVLPAEDPARRDALVNAGADDVLYAPVEFEDLLHRILYRAGHVTAPAARASVETHVGREPSMVEMRGTDLSRDEVRLVVPDGVPVPPPGLLLQARMTLYEGGTFTVWGRTRVAASAPGIQFRFAGLFASERQAIQYFVDWFLKEAGAASAAGEELLLEPTDPSPAGDPILAELASTPPDVIAGYAAAILVGKPSGTPPAGLDPARLKGFMARLAATESGAMRGAPTYAAIGAELACASGAKLKLFELAWRLRDGKDRLEKAQAEQVTLQVLGEAHAVSEIVQRLIDDMLKSGNTRGMKDLGAIKSGMHTAAVELQTVLDREVLGRASTVPVAPTTAPAGPVKFDRPARAPSPGEAPPATPARAPGGRLRRVAVALFFAGGVPFAGWSLSSVYVPRPPPPFEAERVEFSAGELRVFMAIPRGGKRYQCVVDGSWTRLDPSQKEASLDELARRAATASLDQVEVVDAVGKVLAAFPVSERLKDPSPASAASSPAEPSSTDSSAPATSPN